MGVWTINGQSLASLKVSDISFSFGNQVADEATLVYDAPFDAEGIGFAPDAVVAIALDRQDGQGSVVRLRGVAGDMERTGSASSEGRQQAIRGPWWWFEQTVYGVVNTYDNVTQYSGRFNLGGALVPQVHALVDFMAGYGKVIKGNIDLPTITVPVSEERDLVVAQALRRLLKWLPGVRVSFDYTTTPPTMHVLQAGSAWLQQLSYSLTSGARVISGRQRSDMVLPNVVLQYERQIRRETVIRPAGVVTGSNVESKTFSTGYEYVGIDQHPVGGVFPRTLHRTRTLSGGKSRKVYQWTQGTTTGWNTWASLTQSASVTLGSTTYVNWYNILNVWPSFTGLPSWVRPGASADCVTIINAAGFQCRAESKITASSPAETWKSGTTISSPAFAAPAAPELAWVAIPSSNYAPMEEVRRSDDFDSGVEMFSVKVIGTFIRRSAPSTVLAFEAYWNMINPGTPQGTTRTRRDGTAHRREINEDDTTWEAMPSGVAKKIYDTLSGVSFEGRIQVEGGEAAFPTALQGLAVVPGYGSGLLERWSISSSVGELSLEFGRPSQLSAGDIIDLLAAGK